MPDDSNLPQSSERDVVWKLCVQHRSLYPVVVTKEDLILGRCYKCIGDKQGDKPDGIRMNIAALQTVIVWLDADMQEVRK